MSWRIECGIASMILEALALSLPWWHGDWPAVLGGSLLLHGGAILAALPLITPLARGADGRLALARLLWLLLLAAGLPFLGVTIIGCLHLGYRKHSELARYRHFGVVSHLVFRDLRNGEDRLLRIDELTDQLLFPGSSTADRMKALLSIQDMPSRATAAIFRSALGDNTDDVRLLAYGLLDAREKEIARQIEQLAKHPGNRHPGDQATEKASCARELAELHWELVYQRLVEGNVRQFCIEQAMKYATQALRDDRHDAGLWLLLGRAKLLTGDHDGARADFSSAAALGIPHGRVAPYLAELAYLKRDFEAVRRLLHAPLTPMESTMPLPSGYWTRGEQLSW